MDAYVLPLLSSENGEGPPARATCHPKENGAPLRQMIEYSTQYLLLENIAEKNV